MAKNRIFLPEQLLGSWLSRRSAELSSDELMLFPFRRRFRLVEAARVMGEVTGAGDRFGISGQVKTLNFLLELGAELFGSSMIIEDSAFRVV
ncbi:MAG TPA: hypothetical protein VFQ35_07075, partial [Polyangiaceae bacterium]|nr:hypothetical protein [Polyangiaceae bacterium]